MILHEAIKIILEGKGIVITIQKILDELNKRELYHYKDGKLITVFQVHRRTKHYPLIYRNGNRIEVGIN